MQPESVTLHIPKGTPSQNTYGRMHFRAQGNLRDSYRMIVRQQVVETGLHLLAVPERRRIVIRRFSCKRLDRGNFIGGCKALLDALTLEGVIKDDDEQHLDDVYEQHHAPMGHQKTEIEVWT